MSSQEKTRIGMKKRQLDFTMFEHGCQGDGGPANLDAVGTKNYWSCWEETMPCRSTVVIRNMS